MGRYAKVFFSTQDKAKEFKNSDETPNSLQLGKSPHGFTNGYAVYTEDEEKDTKLRRFLKENGNQYRWDIGSLETIKKM